MPYNIGKIDLIIRMILAILLGTLYFLNILEGTIGNVAFLISFILFFTAIKGCCPLYTIVGFGTCNKRTTRTKPRIKVKKLKL